MTDHIDEKTQNFGKYFVCNPHINQLLNATIICFKIYAKLDGIENNLNP